MSFVEDRVNAFVSDVTHEDLCDKIDPFSVDIVTLVRLSSYALKPVSYPLLCLRWQETLHV